MQMKESPKPLSCGIPKPKRSNCLKSITKPLDENIENMLKNIKRTRMMRNTDDRPQNNFRSISSISENIGTLSRKPNKKLIIKENDLKKENIHNKLEFQRSNNLTPVAASSAQNQTGLIASNNFDQLHQTKSVTAIKKAVEPRNIEADESKRKELNAVVCKVKTGFLKLAYKALNRMQARQRKQKFKFVIYTKGLLRARKLSQKLVANVRSNKAAETLSKPANNLLQTDSRHVQTRSQMSTQQSLTPARVNQKSSSKICLAVSSLDNNQSHCSVRDIYTADDDNRASCKLMFKRSNQQVLKLKKRHRRNNNLASIQSQFESGQNGDSKRFQLKSGVLLLPLISQSHNFLNLKCSNM